MHVYWDKESGPVKWPSSAVSVARLCCACSHADYSLVTVIRADHERFANPLEGLAITCVMPQVS